ncbi:MAG: hypothetical protein KDK76_05030 [Chlamydiia bacterium]|nr:hypothetical protein [Chlamydiia bacterium]
MLGPTETRFDRALRETYFELPYPENIDAFKERFHTYVQYYNDPQKFNRQPLANRETILHEAGQSLNMDAKLDGILWDFFQEYVKNHFEQIKRTPHGNAIFNAFWIIT